MIQALLRVHKMKCSCPFCLPSLFSVFFFSLEVTPATNAAEACFLSSVL